MCDARQQSLRSVAQLGPGTVQVSATDASGSTQVAIPTHTNGDRARYIAISGKAAGARHFFFRFGDSNVVAAVATGQQMTGDGSVLMVDVSGQTHVAVIMLPGNTASPFHMTPLENI